MKRHLKGTMAAFGLAAFLTASIAHADDCGSGNANGIAPAIKAWRLLRMSLNRVTAGFGFSVESAREGGTGDYAEWVTKERQSNKLNLDLEYRSCSISKEALTAAFHHFYEEVVYVGDTFAGVGEGNLIQFPECSGRFGANAARNTVVQLLDGMYPTVAATQDFIAKFPTSPMVWDTIYKPLVTNFQLPDCAEWVAPSTVALWYAAHAATIVNMEGMARFPDWDQRAPMAEIARVIRGKLHDQFAKMVFEVNEDKSTCSPGQ